MRGVLDLVEMKSTHANPPEKICRLCLSDSGVILPIFEGEVSERFSVPLPQKILSCLAIKVCADDPLPPHICHRCLYEVDRFHEFRETCKRTNTTFNKICNNSGDSIPFDVNQVLEIKQELHEESIYHDAIGDLLSDDEIADISSSRIKKRNRCISLLESMKRVQQAQSAVSANSSHSEQLPTEWMEQSKAAQPSNSDTTAALISTALECRFCAKPFMYESSLLEHEEHHTKGVVMDNDSMDEVGQIHPKEHVGHEQLVPSSTQVQTRRTSTPIPSLSPLPVSVSSPAVTSSVTDVSSPSIPSSACDPDPTAMSTSFTAPTPTVDSAHNSTSSPVLALAPTSVPTTVLAPPSTTVPDPAPVSVPPPVIPITSTSSPSPAPVLSSTSSTLSVSVLSAPIPTPSEIIDSAMVAHEVYEAHTVSSQDSSHSQHSVDAVSLTDVTTMLLEGAFEGVSRPINSPAPSLCRYCQEPFNSTDLLRRHERLYCSRKPSIMKHKQLLPQQPLQQSQQIQQNSQPPPQPSVDTALPAEGQTHLIRHQQQSQGLSGVARQPPIQQANQQIILNRKVVVEATPIEAPRSCKYCQKDFIHRGSLWRHQMFCDANPEKDLNRIVAGSKKKSVLTKGCNQRNDPQQDNIVSDSATVSTNCGVGGTQLRRSNTQPNSGPLKCKFCEKRFLHRGSWWRHQKMFCAVNPDIPTVQAESRARSIQGTANFACRYCERTFLHRGSCWHHEQTHTGIKEHACRYCSKTFNEKSRLARHERMHLGIKPFSCRQCGKAFCDASNLRNHEQIHGDRTSFLCAWCGKSYTRRALLLKHEQVHAGEGEIFLCSLCPRTFPDSNTLNEHSLSHSEEKRRIYLCQTCGQTFRSHRLLSQHNDLNHTQVLLPQQKNLPTLHSASVNQTHLAQEPTHHSCTICNKSFPDLPALQQHELLHSTESKQYQCSHNACTAVFHEQSQLEAHLVNHGGEKAHVVSPSIALGADSSFHQHHLQQTHSQQQQNQHQETDQQQQLISHEIQHQHSLPHHELIHREGAYVLEGQELSGQTISVHHLVGQIQ